MLPGGINIHEFFQMLNPNQQKKKIKIAKISNQIVNQQQYENYSNQIKILFDEIFYQQDDQEEDKKKQVKIENKINFKIRQTPMPICNKILNHHQHVFRCYDCMAHQSSVLCKQCFEKANHKGHRYAQITSGGGNCDCGNPDAINPKGYCSNHPGKAQPVLVDQKQQQHFLQVFLHFCQWIFRLSEKDLHKSSDALGQVFATFLLKINQRSLYYNTLTFKLLFSQRKYAISQGLKQQKIIDKIFEYGVKCINFARKITEVFLNMFSLQVFKYQLAASFTEAYNKFNKFQKSEFKSLYIQLFANNQLIQRILTQKKQVLAPYNRRFSYSQHVQNLIFLSSIKPEVACHFFQILMKKGIIPFNELEIIQQQVQQGNNHIITVTNDNLNNENFYYTLFFSILKLVKNKHETLKDMLKSYSQIIVSNKYSYQKNKIVMPFHKILSLIILAIYNGNINKLDYLQLENMLQSQDQMKLLVHKVFKLILTCFKQFVTSFFEPNYFDNYSPLYSRSGNTIIIFDMLMLIICINAFNQIKGGKQTMNSILREIFCLEKVESVKMEEQCKQENQSQKDEEWEDLQEIDNEQKKLFKQQIDQSQDKYKDLKQNIQLLRLLIQTCITQRPQVLCSNSLKIQNQYTKQKTQKLFLQIVSNFNEINQENLNLIHKNFVQNKNLEEVIAKKVFTFDKIKKKYFLNQNAPSKKLPLHLYPSIKRLGGIFAQQKQLSPQQWKHSIFAQKENIQRLIILFNQQFLDELTQKFLEKLSNLPEKDKQLQKIQLDFLQIMHILRILMKQNCPKSIQNYLQKISQLSATKQQFQFLKQKLFNKIDAEDQKKLEKERLKKRLQQKKKSKIEQMKKKQTIYDNMINQQKIEEQENQHLCIICRQDNKSIGLCYLAYYDYTNTLQAVSKIQGRSLTFRSCFHPIHIKCFIKSSKNTLGKIPCPLCKSQSNIMLPFEKYISNQTMIQQIYQRVITLKATFNEKYKGYDFQYEEFGILSIIRSLCSIISRNLIQKESFLSEKYQRISNTLYGLIQNVFYSIIGEKVKQRQNKGINMFLECLKQKISSTKTQSTSLYALQYVLLKIIYNCLTKNPNLCSQIIKQPQTKLINQIDLKKAWQMCGQIVSLPNYVQVEKLTQQTKMINQVKQISQGIDIYIPPKNIKQLIEQRDHPQYSCKNGHQMCVCIICKTKACYQCKQAKGHTIQHHNGEALFFNLLTGGFILLCDNRIVRIPSFFTNDLGKQWKPSKQPEGFEFDSLMYEQLKRQLLNQTMVKFLMIKFPDAFKKMQYGQLQQLMI